MLHARTSFLLSFKEMKTGLDTVTHNPEGSFIKY